MCALLLALLAASATADYTTTVFYTDSSCTAPATYGVLKTYSRAYQSCASFNVGACINNYISGYFKDTACTAGDIPTTLTTGTWYLSWSGSSCSGAPVYATQMGSPTCSTPPYMSGGSFQSTNYVCTGSNAGEFRYYTSKECSGTTAALPHTGVCTASGSSSEKISCFGSAVAAWVPPPMPPTCAGATVPAAATTDSIKCYEGQEFIVTNVTLPSLGVKLMPYPISGPTGRTAFCSAFTAECPNVASCYGQPIGTTVRYFSGNGGSYVFLLYSSPQTTILHLPPPPSLYPLNTHPTFSPMQFGLFPGRRFGLQ